MKIVTPMFFWCLLVFAGVFSGVRPAFAQLDEVCPRPAEFPPLDPNAATAEQVENGEATLTEFVTDYFTYALQVSTSPLAAGYFGCALTHEGPWNYGSTYIATMTPRGTLVLHGKDILLSGGVVDSTMLQIVSEAASAAVTGSTFEFEGDDGYALSYFNPDGSAAFLTAGLDIRESHLVEDVVDPGDPPAVTARDVKDRETLKAFVNGALDYMRGLYETEGFDATLRVKRILRDTTGYWRHGPTYLFVIDLTGYTFFHGAFPEKYELRAPTNTLRDAVTGELILPQIIEAATSNEEGGFVTYHFDNPDDDTDSAEIPKVTFARQYEVTFTLPNGNPASLKAIIGAGIYEDAVAACPRPDGIPALNPNATTAEQVENGDATLTEFVTALLTYGAQIRGLRRSFGYIGCLATHEGPWNFGSTYLVTMTSTGRLVLHGQDVLLTGGLLDSPVFGSIAAAASALPIGSAFEFEGDDGYAFPSMQPDGSQGIATIGLDIRESHLVEETLDPGAAPAVTARDVTDRESLQAFVNGAADYLEELYAAGGLDAILKVKKILRDMTGYWRHGPTYLFIMDRNGYTLFHGAFPEKYELQAPTETLTDAVTGELILPKIIAAATSDEEGGFVEYHFDNPDDDTDSAEIPKVTFALEREFIYVFPDSTERPFDLILGAGIYETGVTSVEPLDGEIPAAFALEQNYPNPFNPSTTIEFSLERAQTIALTVYDMLGRKVRVLADGLQPAGRYSTSFDGAGLAWGTYLYVLRTEQNVSVKKMILLK